MPTTTDRTTRYCNYYDNSPETRDVTAAASRVRPGRRSTVFSDWSVSTSKLKIGSADFDGPFLFVRNKKCRKSESRKKRSTSDNSTTRSWDGVPYWKRTDTVVGLIPATAGYTISYVSNSNRTPRTAIVISRSVRIPRHDAVDNNIIEFPCTTIDH